MAAVEAIELGKRKKRGTGAEMKPTFSDDQVIHASEVQRHFKEAVESRLPEVDFLVMYSGKTPKAAILDYKKFVALWAKAQEMADRLIELEATRRILRARASGRPLTTLEELAVKAGLTQEDLEDTPDVELVPK